MLVGRELEELCWEPVKMDDPRLTAHPDWLKKFRDFAWSDLDSLTLHQSARIERTEKGFQIWIYNRTDYIYVGIETNPFNEYQRQTFRGYQIEFPVPTDNTFEMIPYALYIPD